MTVLLTKTLPQSCRDRDFAQVKELLRYTSESLTADIGGGKTLLQFAIEATCDEDIEQLISLVKEHSVLADSHVCKSFVHAAIVENRPKVFDALAKYYPEKRQMLLSDEVSSLCDAAILQRLWFLRRFDAGKETTTRALFQRSARKLVESGWDMPTVQRVSEFSKPAKLYVTAIKSDNHVFLQQLLDTDAELAATVPSDEDFEAALENNSYRVLEVLYARSRAAIDPRTTEAIFLLASKWLSRSDDIAHRARRFLCRQAENGTISRYPGFKLPASTLQDVMRRSASHPDQALWEFVENFNIIFDRTEIPNRRSASIQELDLLCALPEVGSDYDVRSRYRAIQDARAFCTVIQMASTGSWPGWQAFDQLSELPKIQPTTPELFRRAVYICLLKTDRKLLAEILQHADLPAERSVDLVDFLGLANEFASSDLLELIAGDILHRAQKQPLPQSLVTHTARINDTAPEDFQELVGIPSRVCHLARELEGPRRIDEAVSLPLDPNFRSQLLSSGLWKKPVLLKAVADGLISTVSQLEDLNATATQTTTTIL